MVNDSLYDVKIGQDDEFLRNSREIKVKQGSKYRLSTEVRVLKGKPFSAYFGVVFLNNQSKETERKIKWLNDVSGTKKIINMIFESPTEKIVMVYRINAETPVKSECQLSILPLDKISLDEVDSKIKEDFERPTDFVLPRPKELTPEQEEMLEQNLVWIFGSTRSGTTWLGLELLSHNTHSINESYITHHLGFRQEAITDEVIRGFDRRYEEPDYFFSKQFQDTWIFYLRKMILNRIYAQVTDLSKKIVLKEPMRIGASDIISKCLPKSRIIILMRDGRDILDSRIDARQEDSWAAKTGVSTLESSDRLTFIETYGKIWVKLMEILMNTFHNHPKDLRFLVKYEELRKNTVEELKKIYDFLQIDIKKNELEDLVKKYSFENVPSELKGKGKFRRYAVPGKWKENFSKSEISLMDKIMGKTLGELGY